MLCGLNFFSAFHCKPDISPFLHFPIQTLFFVVGLGSVLTSGKLRGTCKWLLPKPCFVFHYLLLYLHSLYRQSATIFAWSSSSPLCLPDKQSFRITAVWLWCAVIFIKKHLYFLFGEKLWKLLMCQKDIGFHRRGFVNILTWVSCCVFKIACKRKLWLMKLGPSLCIWAQKLVT